MQVVISTAILLIATIIAASLFTAAAISELYTFENTFKQLGARNEAVFGSNIAIIGETNESSPNRIIIWVKNIGTTSFVISGSANGSDEQYWDVFITFPNGTYSRFAYCPTAQNACFNVSLLNAVGTPGLWQTGETVQLTIYTGSIPAGAYQVSLSLSNGVTAQDNFSF